MATIRNRNGRWHVQVRRSGSKSVNRTFTLKSDAQLWAREQERAIDLDGLDLPLESSSSEYIEAKDESGRIFTFWRGQFHFSYISHKHISSISGECLPIPRLNES